MASVLRNDASPDLPPRADVGTRVAPLGLRFWDLATRTFVGDDLDVTAFPQGHERLVSRASPSPSGVWGIHHLAGLAAFERALAPGARAPSPVDDAFWASPDLGGAPRPYVIRVTDPRRRFLPIEVVVPAPARWIFEWSVPGATRLPAGPGGAIPLFSSPARKAPPGMATLRADLSSPPTATDDKPRPAAWALVAASLGGSALAFGLSDAEGRATLFFPWPEASNGVDTAPPLTDRTWDLALSAWFDPPPPGEDAPPRAVLPAVLAQAPRTLFQKHGLAAADQVPLGAAQLRYGQELSVASSDGKGRLWVA
jgi:hypothetical protein